MRADLLAKMSGPDEDEGELGELRRLELDGPEGQPVAVAVDA